MLFLNLHFDGIVLDEIFMGLWLLPLALLVYRSRFLPRFLGVWGGWRRDFDEFLITETGAPK